jgi:SPP1 gp7 family putative phage head morphogenesis protein
VLRRALDAHAPAVAAKLAAARASFEADFWRRVDEHGIKADAAIKAASDAITQAQVAALARAIADAEGESYADALYDAQEILVEVGWANGKALLDLETGYDVAPPQVLRRLRDAAAELDSQINLREKGVLKDVLERAFAEGLSVVQTRDLLKETFAEGFHSVDKDGNVVRRTPTDTWATTVARTELADAANQGTMELYAEAGVQRVEWIASDSVNVCPECEAADGEVVDLGEDFPEVDVDAPPAHANCVCTTAPADEDLGSFRGTEEQQDRAARGGYSADEFEAKFGFTHPIDDEE